MALTAKERKERYKAKDPEGFKKKQREYQREYRRRRAENNINYDEEYRRTHKEQIAARAKQYQQTHAEELKKYREDHREEYLKYTSEYQKKKREEEKNLEAEVIALRKELNRAEPDYEYPPLPKRTMGDSESEKAYNKAIYQRKRMKINYLEKEKEMLLAMKKRVETSN